MCSHPIESICEQYESNDLVSVKEKRNTNTGGWIDYYSEGSVRGTVATQRYEKRLKKKPIDFLRAFESRKKNLKT
jgi:hypothetical protein